MTTQTTSGIAYICPQCGGINTRTLSSGHRVRCIDCQTIASLAANLTGGKTFRIDQKSTFTALGYCAEYDCERKASSGVIPAEYTSSTGSVRSFVHESGKEYCGIHSPISKLERQYNRDAKSRDKRAAVKSARDKRENNLENNLLVCLAIIDGTAAQPISDEERTEAYRQIRQAISYYAARGY